MYLTHRLKKKWNKKLKILKRDPHIIVDFKTTLSVIDNTNRKKINKDRRTIARYIFFLSGHVTYKIDDIVIEQNLNLKQLKLYKLCYLT